MNLWQRLMHAYWQSQAQYLRGRIEELRAVEQHTRAERETVEQRLQRAENRLIQYGSVA